MIFFFQAEDGIRDYKVTGVQTCALPIWQVAIAATIVTAVLFDINVVQDIVEDHWLLRSAIAAAIVASTSTIARSEERRVGKEGRGGGRLDRAKREYRPEVEANHGA